jgi:hypothetical protein
MKIRIIKATPDKWYAKLVGKTRVAKSIHGSIKEKHRCFVMRNYRTLLRLIPLTDAEIIK